MINKLLWRARELEVGLTDQHYDLLSFASFQDQAAEDLHAGHQQHGCRGTQNAHQLQLLKDEGLQSSFRKPWHWLVRMQVCSLTQCYSLARIRLELGALFF